MLAAELCPHPSTPSVRLHGGSPAVHTPAGLPRLVQSPAASRKGRVVVKSVDDRRLDSYAAAFEKGEPWAHMEAAMVRSWAEPKLCSS